MDLRQFSEYAKNYNPVFIIGQMRGGSSILYRTIQKHSSFRLAQENLTESDIFCYANRSHLLTKNGPKSVLDYMVNNQNLYDNLLANIAKIQRFHRRIGSFDFTLGNRISNRLLWFWYASLNHCVVQAYYFFAHQARGCSRLIDKPNNAQFIEHIQLAFPRSRLIYIYRHPIDVYSSYRKRGQIEKTGWTQITPQVFCRLYAYSVNKVLKLSEQNSNCIHLVRYEAFTHNPEEQFSLICRFLGEPFEAQATKEERPNLQKYHIDPHLFGDIVTRTKNWTDYIAEEEALLIENKLRDSMHRLGYQPYTEGVG